MSYKKKLGIIQTRGLGDIYIALPIALYYFKKNYEIYWPIGDNWIQQMKHYVPWVNWISVDRDSNDVMSYFYHRPLTELQNVQVQEIFCLYYYLRDLELHNNPYFTYTNFDRFKYYKACVPFSWKWKLAECITRDHKRENALYEKKVSIKIKDYAVTHIGSENFDRSILPSNCEIIPITDEGYLLDWLKIIEKARYIVTTNSSVCNIVDQLNIGQNRYFVPAGKYNSIAYTPVFGSHWNFLPRQI
jgi:hypothetical protein